jgi:hypothetical protein
MGLLKRIFEVMAKSLRPDGAQSVIFHSPILLVCLRRILDLSICFLTEFSLILRAFKLKQLNLENFIAFKMSSNL